MTPDHSPNPSEQDAPRSVNFEDVRQKAVELSSVSHVFPRLRDVAYALGISRDQCRQLINRARKDAPDSFPELSMRRGSFSDERKLLAGFNAMIKSERAMTLAVHQVLKLAQNQELSPQQARIMVFAITSAQSDYQKLDLEYAKIFKMDPHLVSSSLHSSRRKRTVLKGIVETCEESLIAAAKKDNQDTPRGQRSREFIANCISLFRAQAERQLFTTFMQGKSPSPEIVKIIGAAVAKELEYAWPKKLVVTPGHFLLLRNLLEEKSTGKFTTLKDFAQRHLIDASGIDRAFKNRGESLGLPDRISAGALRLNVEDPDRVAKALVAVRRAKVIAPEEARVLREVLDRIEGAQVTLLDREKEALRFIFESKIEARNVQLAEMGKALGVGTGAASLLLHGRGARRGVLATLNNSLRMLPSDEQRHVLDFYCPFDEAAYKPLIMKLARVNPVDEKELKQKERLVDVVVGVILENESMVMPMITQFDGGRPIPRRLQSYECAALLRAFLGHHRGNLQLMCQDITDILGSRHELEMSQKVARTFLFGRTNERKVLPGAIRKFVNAIKPLRKDLVKLSRIGDQELINSNSVPEYLLNSPLLGWATTIVREPKVEQRARLMGVFCATRPHTLRELANEGRSLQPHEVSPGGRRFLAQLRVLLAESPLLITDPGVAKQLEYWHSLNEKKGIKDCLEMKPLLIVSNRRGVEIGSLATFLSNVHRNSNWIHGLVLIEETANLAYGAQAQTLSARERLYVRRVYDHFLQQTFGGLFAPQEYKHLKSNFSDIQEMAEKRRVTRHEDERRASLWVEEFFQHWKLEVVVKRFCSHLIQGPTNPRGLPYPAVLDAANEAVFEAARKYHPETYAAEGRPIAAFSTFAIMCIRWTVLRDAKRFAEELKRTPIHFEDRLGGSRDGEETTFGAMVAASSEPEDLELQVKAEQLMKALDQLNPVARRAMQLHFSLVKEEQGADMTNEEIARVLHREGITEHELSRERIRQIIAASVVKLRAQAYTGSRAEWASFFESIEGREVPRPLMVDTEQSSYSVVEGLVFPIDRSERGKPIVFDVERVFRMSAREHQVIVRARNVTTLEDLGLFDILVERGKVVSCERIE